MGLFSRRPKATKITHLDELKPLIESGQPVLLDFFQIGCAPCQVMDGIVNELAHEYAESAHVVKVDVTKVAGAGQAFNVRSTPTFVLLGRASHKESAKSRKARQRRGEKATAGTITTRWRATGLVKKDQMARVLESNGAVRVS